jgi:S1-C subfamily serine protease
MKQPNEESNSKNNPAVWLATTLLALAAGGVGGYFSYSFFMTPGLSSLNEISPDLMNRTRPIIQEAKKVVVEQNDQIQNVAGTLSNNLLAIVPKQDKSAANWQKTYYDPSLKVGEALPMTSDGWLLTSFNQLNDDLGRSAKNFVIISKDGSVYEIESVVKDSFTNTTFLRIQSRNLPVSKFADTPSGKNGNLLVAASFDGRVNNYYQVSSFIGTTSTVKSADLRNEEIKLNAKTDNYLALANLAGEIEAFVSPSGVWSSRTVNADFAALLKFKQIKRPSLGFDYLDESALTPVKSGQAGQKSIILYSDTAHAWPKNGPAQISGLKSNDRIVSVNGTELTPDNKDILFSVLPGDTLKLGIKRNDQAVNIDLQVGELK